MKTEDFDYHLAPERIAQTPVEPRDSSRLMVVSRGDGCGDEFGDKRIAGPVDGRIEHRYFRNIVDYLRPGDVLVCNESRVIPARLYGRKKETGGRVEVLLIAKRGADLWEALVKPGRRVREGMAIEFGRESNSADSGDATTVVGTIVGRTEAGGRLIRFANAFDPFGEAGDVDKRLEGLGVMPLPPYVHVPLADPGRYQTVYAREKGSVAAPTAGLHFTPELMARVREMGVEFAFVTLHIGLDTFRPVQVENVAEHKMHSEYCELSEETSLRVDAARREGRRIIAVGTTSVRVLESAASAAVHAGLPRVVAPFRGSTDIFIYPGYEFRAVDAMVTNFHLPRSTLLMLVSAFAGRGLIRRAYAEAIAGEYRFYSFGDAMLLW